LIIAITFASSSLAIDYSFEYSVRDPTE